MQASAQLLDSRIVSGRSLAARDAQRTSKTITQLKTSRNIRILATAANDDGNPYILSNSKESEQSFGRITQRSTEKGKRRKPEPKIRVEDKYGWTPFGEEPYDYINGKKVFVDEMHFFGFLDKYKDLNPLNPETYNAAAYMWKKISEIPEERRGRLLEWIQPRHITRIWEITKSRYFNENLFLEDARDMLPDPRIEMAGDTQIWDGKIGGLPESLQWLSDFQQIFFLGNDEKAYGYAKFGGAFGALSKSLFPLYYRVKQENTLKISMYEKCDVSLVFGDGQLHLEEIGLPEGFPKPKSPFWPFNNGMKMYLRAAGPGIIVGQLWEDGEFVDSEPKQFLGGVLLIRRSKNPWVDPNF